MNITTSDMKKQVEGILGIDYINLVLYERDGVYMVQHPLTLTGFLYAQQNNRLYCNENTRVNETYIEMLPEDREINYN